MASQDYPQRFISQLKSFIIKTQNKLVSIRFIIIKTRKKRKRIVPSDCRHETHKKKLEPSRAVVITMMMKKNGSYLEMMKPMRSATRTLIRAERWKPRGANAPGGGRDARWTLPYLQINTRTVAVGEWIAPFVAADEEKKTG